jgi:lipoate-protein ligase A
MVGSNRMSFTVLPFVESDATHQMGVDMRLFRIFDSQGSSAIMRFYKIWPPAITIGYHQNEQAVAELVGSLPIDLVRRPTGGRAVLHLGDLTYSILGETPSSFFGTRTLEIYHSICKGVKSAIKKLGIELKSSRNFKVASSPLCFQSASKYELIYGDEKLTGGALLRRNGRFLFQGSIVVDPPSQGYGRLSANRCGLSTIVGKRLRLEELAQTITEGFEESLGVEIRPGKWPKGCLDKKRFFL